MDFRVDPSIFSMEKTRKLNNLPPEQKQITEREYRECQNALKNVKKVVAAATQDGTTQSQIDACLHGKMKKELKDLLQNSVSRGMIIGRTPLTDGQIWKTLKKTPARRSC